MKELSHYSNLLIQQMNNLKYSEKALDHAAGLVVALNDMGMVTQEIIADSLHDELSARVLRLEREVVGLSYMIRELEELDLRAELREWIDSNPDDGALLLAGMVTGEIPNNVTINNAPDGFRKITKLMDESSKEQLKSLL